MTAATAPAAVQCPACGRWVRPRADGTLGAHFSVRSVRGRMRCAASGAPPYNAAAHHGRRVTVTVDAVIPRGATIADFRSAVRAAVQSVADDAFVVTVTVSDSAPATEGAPS